MIEGLEILIARMDTNPDEFINGEWDYFLEDHPLHSEIFTEEELKAWESARERLHKFKIERQRRFFTEQVISKIIGRDEILPSPKRAYPYTAQNVRDILKSGVEVVMEKEWNKP